MSQLRADKDEAYKTMMRQLPDYYKKNWALETKSLNNYLTRLEKVRTCEQKSRVALTPCEVIVPLRYELATNVAITWDLEILTFKSRCDYYKQGLENIVTPEGRIAYGVGRLWVLNPEKDLLCKNTELGQSRRFWTISGTQDGAPAGIFVGDFPYPDDMTMPDELFWGRQIKYYGNQKLVPKVISDETLRFQWQSGAYVDISTNGGQITNSNVIAPSMYSPECRTLTEPGHYIPHVEILPEGLGFVEKVEDISS